MAKGQYLSIITLNVNGLNAPTKTQRLVEWIQKQHPYICCLQETHLKTMDTYRLKVKGWKKIFHANRDQKKAGLKNKTRVPTLTTTIQHSFGSVGHSNQSRKIIQGSQIGKEVKLSLCANDMILYIENPKDSTRKLLELIS